MSIIDGPRSQSAPVSSCGKLPSFLSFMHEGLLYPPKLVAASIYWIPSSDKAHAPQIADFRRPIGKIWPPATTTNIQLECVEKHGVYERVARRKQGGVYRVRVTGRRVDRRLAVFPNEQRPPNIRHNADRVRAIPPHCCWLPPFSTYMDIDAMKESRKEEK